MQSTIVRTITADVPEVQWCVDCTEDVRLVRSAGYGGQDLIFLATERRGDRDVCRRHAAMHDEFAAEVAAAEAEQAFEDDLLVLVSATVWSESDEQVAAAIAEINDVWTVAS